MRIENMPGGNIKLSGLKKDAGMFFKTRFKRLGSVAEIFFPKAIGVALQGDDLLITKVCKRSFDTIKETEKIRDFMSQSGAIDRLGFKSIKRSLNEVVFSVSRENVIVRELEFPGTDLKEFKEALNYQLDSFIPFEADDVYYDVFKGNDNGLSGKLFIIAIRKSNLDKVVEQLKNLGIEPTRVVTTPLSFIPIVGEKQGTVVVVNKVNDVYCYNTFKEGSFISSLFINGKDDLKRKISFDKPDEIMEDVGLDFSETELNELIDNGETGQAGAGEAIAEEEPQKKISSISRLDDNIESFGAAMLGIQNERQRFSLLNTGRRVFNLQKILMVCFLCSLLFFMFFIPNVIKNRKLETLEFINKEIRLLKDDIFKIEDVRNRLSIIEGTLISVGKLQADYAGRAHVLLELSEKLPPTAWVRELYISRKIFEIGGVAQSATELIPILEDSELFYSVGFTAPVVKNDDGNESFRLKGAIKILEKKSDVVE